MKNNFIIFIAVTSLFLSYNGFGQGADQDENLSETMYFQDPFKSQLPKSEIVLPAPKADTTTAKTTKVMPEEIITPPTLHITGLVWGTTRPQAIINNQVVDIGSIIDGATITYINKSGVEIFYRGQRFTLDPNKQMSDQKMAQLNKNTPMNLDQSRFAR